MSEMAESKLCLKGGLATGLESLDKILLGLRRGELSLLASLPFHLSDNLASQIAIRCAQGVDCSDEPVGGSPLHRVLYFSMETTKDSDRRRRLADKGVIVDDTCEWEMNDLLMRAKREQEKNGIELIVLDLINTLYIKELRDKGLDGGSIGRGTVAMMFKDMAKKLNVHIIVISSVTRPHEGSPGLVEISWRAGPNDAYDVIMLIERRYPECLRSARISVLKNSHGKTGCVDVGFLVDEWRFVENLPCARSSVCDLYRLGREKFAKGMRREAVDCFLKGDLLGDSGALERLARCYVVSNVAGWFAVAKHLLGLATVKAREEERGYFQSRYDSFLKLEENGDSDARWRWFRGERSRE